MTRRESPTPTPVHTGVKSAAEITMFNGSKQICTKQWKHPAESHKCFQNQTIFWWCRKSKTSQEAPVPLSSPSPLGTVPSSVVVVLGLLSSLASGVVDVEPSETGCVDAFVLVTCGSSIQKEQFVIVRRLFQSRVCFSGYNSVALVTCHSLETTGRHVSERKRKYLGLLVSESRFHFPDKWSYCCFRPNICRSPGHLGNRAHCIRFGWRMGHLLVLGKLLSVKKTKETTWPSFSSGNKREPIFGPKNLSQS